MKGVILAGGSGTRLYPLTKVINKHLLPVGKQPMIIHSIHKLKQAGITDILLVIERSSAGLYARLLGSGKEWDVRLSYKVQDDAGGIADALALAEGFIGKQEKFIALLGDNLFEDRLTPYLQAFSKQEHGAKILLKEVTDPRRYGVPVLAGDTIISIEEKPKHPQSRYCVTGIYMYDDAVFDVIRSIHPSERGELEITDVNNVYARQGDLTYHVLVGWWIDAGTFDSLREAAAQLSGEEDAF